MNEVKSEENWFRFWNMKSVKTHTKLPFGVTKKDPGLVFHFHVSKMLVKVRFDQYSNEHKKFKKN
jgi:hypothetical protein